MADLTETYNEINNSDGGNADQGSQEQESITRNENFDEPEQEFGEAPLTESDDKAGEAPAPDGDGEGAAPEGEGEPPAEAKKEEASLDYYKRNSEALENLMQIPEARQVIADAIAGKYDKQSGTQQQEAAPDLSDISFEGMTDQQIAEKIAEVSSYNLRSTLLPRIAQLEQLLNELVGERQEAKISKLVSDKKTYPLAEKNASAIKNLMSKGLDFETAYYAACGKQLKEQGFQTGLKRAQEKSKGDILPTGKGKPAGNAVSNKKASTIAEAYDQIMHSKQLK